MLDLDEKTSEYLISPIKWFVLNQVVVPRLDSVSHLWIKINK